MKTLQHTQEATAPRATLGRGTAHAKVILIGEHAVVYGAPAIAVPAIGLAVEATVTVAAAADAQIHSTPYTGPAAAAPAVLGPTLTALQTACDLFGTVGSDELHLTIRSAVPDRRGLGSSAAVAAAIGRAVAELAGAMGGAATVAAVVRAAERVAHGTPSGLDSAAVLAGGPIWFLQGQSRPVALGAPLHLVVADAGSPGATAEAVAKVRQYRQERPAKAAEVFAELAQLAELAAHAIENGRTEQLGPCLSRAQALLSGIGVSTTAVDTLVRAATGAGALGAKLTGGGLGGCVIAVAAEPADLPGIAEALSAAGAVRTWPLRVPAA